ncbi:MAG TPA: hypothetical protein VE052_00995 [Gemmatimonadaceae bacterium]|nr:hypothetical protein [Gemmatimonadaceae bacterium]
MSPLIGTDRMFHLPATSARLTGAGVVVVDVVVEDVDDAIALVLSAEALSFFAHPARTAAQQQIAMRVVRCDMNIQPPV